MVELRPLTEATLSRLVAAALEGAEPDEVTPPVAPGEGWTPERVGWLRAFHRDRRRGLEGPAQEATWAVVEITGEGRDAERVVGSVRLRRTGEPGVLETGIWLVRDARGRGVGRQAVRLVLDRARGAGAVTVRAETMPGNAGAVALLRSLGFRARSHGEHVRADLHLGPRAAVAEDPHVTATRSGYDAIAEEYARTFRAELDGAPLDRAVLGGFAELVRRAHTDAPVLEVGCGPGTVTAHLAALRLDVRGIDLSPAMVALARRAHPGLRFEVGEMGHLDRPDGDLAGLVAWYSLVHVPRTHRQQVVEEFHRVLRPGGHVLVAFQVGDDVLHLDEAFGRPVSLDFHRLRPDDVEELLAGAGFEPTARLVKAPEPTSAASPVPQCVLIVRKHG